MHVKKVCAAVVELHTFVLRVKLRTCSVIEIDLGTHIISLESTGDCQKWEAAFYTKERSQLRVAKGPAPEDALDALHGQLVTTYHPDREF